MSEFELKAGDTIRNTRTGRRGLTYTDTHGDLWVGDTGGQPVVRAEAVEEYEHWYPGTYEKIKETE